MLKFGLSFPVILLVGVLAIDEHVYTATFDRDFSGVSGSFTMRVTNSSMTYSYALDFTEFNTTCDITGGLVYHIHSFWRNTTASSSNVCGDAVTGGHYDPYLACAPVSQAAKDLCVNLSRTAAQGYTYNCNPSMYSAGHHYACEVGDLSSKFGWMKPVSTNTLRYEGSQYDPSPPMTPNFKQPASGIATEWASLVVHCPKDSARMVCASFEFQGIQASADTSETSSSGSDNNDDEYSTGELVGILGGSAVGILIIGVLIGVFFRKQHSPQRDFLLGDKL
jgi:hypothetical protein